MKKNLVANCRRKTTEKKILEQKKAKITPTMMKDERGKEKRKRGKKIIHG